MPKRRRGERDDGCRTGTPTTVRRLYLTFDDWPWGYSIHELDLSPGSPHHNNAAGGERRRRRLPRPIIRVEVPCRSPRHFAAVGTRIVVTHSRNQVSIPDGFQPIVDVRSRGVTFGPGQWHPYLPIYLPVGGDEVFALDARSFHVLSLAKLWPPLLENQCHRDVSEWTWVTLPPPPFDRMYVTSYAVHPHERIILVSTATATFAFDATARVWEERRGEWALPFAGRAHFADGLDAFVGLSKDPASLGHLCSCEAAAAVTGDGEPSWKLGREKMFSDDPAERHVGATLLYLGKNKFCLVQCVSIGGGNAAAVDEELEDDGDGGGDADDEGSREVPECGIFLYLLTTFSLGYGNNGDLTTGETCRVRRYKVPRGTTERFIVDDPVAFWL